MRTFPVLIAAASLVVALGGCTQPTSPVTEPSGSGSSPAPAAQAAPSGQAVWTGTLAGKGYQSWQKAPGFETKVAAKGPHGKSVQVFVDPNVGTTLSGSGATEWPVGSMIVKDAYDAGGALQSVEYMQKTDQGWYYASFGVDGTVAKEGVEVAPCQACHATGSDSVKSFKLP